MKRIFKNSLNLKISAGIVLVVLSIAIVFTPYFYKREKEIDLEAAKDRLYSMANSLSLIAGHFLEHAEQNTLQEYIMTLSVQEGVTKVHVIGKDLKEICSSDPKEIGRPTDEIESIEVLKTGKEQWFLYHTGERAFLRITVPISKKMRGIKRQEDIAGAVLMEIDITRVEQETRDRFFVLSISFGIGILYIITALFFILRVIVINPVVSLRKTALAIGGGDLSIRAKVKSNDEIGSLANSFNAMAADLSVYMQSEKELMMEKLKAEAERKKAEELAQLNEELTSTNEELMQMNEELEAATEELRLANEEAQKAKETAEKRTAELERFNKMVVDRELKMRELKEEIATLKAQIAAQRPQDKE